MRKLTLPTTRSLRQTARRAVVAALTLSLVLPQTALAAVWIDSTELAEGENAVGGGTATYGNSTVDLAGVVADQMTTDEDLTINFNGGNEIEDVYVTGDAEVEVNFAGENEVEDFNAKDQSILTINENGHDELEDITASDQAKVTINVTGEVSIEEIEATDDASVTLRGTDCQRKDIVTIGKDEDDESITTERGDLVIDHVTVVVESEDAKVGSTKGNVVIDTSKVASGDDNERLDIVAGGTLDVRESVIDIDGTMSSQGKMTIEHSDVEVERVDDYDGLLVWSATDIELIREKNGEVKETEVDGKKVKYVDTGDKDEVDLEADGKPAYYKCKDDDDAHPAAKRLASTGDLGSSAAQAATLLAGASLVAVGFALRRKRVQL